MSKEQRILSLRKVCMIGYVFILTLLIVGPVMAATRYVPSQYGTIQAAIDASSSGDVIIISSGTYYGSGNVNVSFSGKNVTVRGAGPANTFIDCDSSGSGNRGFEFTNGETSSARLEDLTIRDGDVRSRQVNFVWDRNGGGVKIQSASPTIENVHFIDNQAHLGGAVHCMKINGYADNVYPTFDECVFEGNFANHQSLSSENGGAILFINSHPDFTDCLFNDNEADAYGGAVYASSSTGSFTNCTFYENEALSSHGGTVLSTASDLEFDNCIIANTVSGYGINAWSSSTIDVDCCDFWNNEAADYVMHSSTISIDDNTIYENPAFCDPDNDDFTIVSTSSCAPDYSLCGQLIGAYGVDCDAPTITAMFPASYITYHAPSAEIIATFSEVMDTTTFDETTFYVFSRTSGQVPGTYAHFPALKWDWFEPTNDFKAGEIVNYVFTRGITDPDGYPVEPFVGTYMVRTSSSSYGYLGDDTLLTADNKPVGVYPADLDGDGDIDLAVPNHDSHTISTFLNNGSGSFASQVIDSSGGNNPWDVTAKDFDNDGDMDLATSNYGSDNVSVYLNDGTGDFTFSANYATGDRPHPILSEDLDGDGDFDLISVNLSDDSMCVFLNDGEAAFASKVCYYVGDGPIGLAGADFDRDGDIDIFTANYYGSKVGFMENNGDGTFAAAVQLSMGGSGPFNVIAMDLDHDGYADLATANRLSDNISVLYQVSGDFDSVVTYDAGNDPYYVCGADLDGDWRIDLIAANLNSDDLSVYMNDGSGDFGTEMRVEAGNGPLWVCAADFDDDDMIDVAVANAFSDDISVYFNVQGGPDQTSPANGYSTSDHSVTLDWDAYSGAVTYEVDVDGDPKFGSIDRQETGLGSTYWDITPDLGHGTWYWRVRAITASDTSNWSHVWSFTIIDAQYVVPSCPVLFSFDGNSFVKENPLLTACEKSGYTDIVTDYYHVSRNAVTENGEVTFQLREMENEITYLYDLELLTVDHSIETNIACSPSGEITAYSNSFAPITAVDNLGQNVLDIVRSVDGNKYEQEGAGYIDVIFDIGSTQPKSGGIVLDYPAKMTCHDPESNDQTYSKVSPNMESADRVFEVEVAYLDATGSWNTLPELPPRTFVGQDVVLIPIESNIVTIRISWDEYYSTDILEYFVASDEEPTVSTNRISSGKVTLNAKQCIWDSFRDNQPLVLQKGDLFEFTFNTGELPASEMSRDYIIRAIGRYEPDYDIFTQLKPALPRLHGNFPNPFNPTTTISYDLSSAGDVRLEIFNVLGQQVRELVNEHQGVGSYNVVWDSRDNSNQPVSSGIYFYRLTTGDYRESKKMLLLK